MLQVLNAFDRGCPVGETIALPGGIDDKGSEAAFDARYGQETVERDIVEGGCACDGPNTGTRQRDFLGFRKLDGPGQ